MTQNVSYRRSNPKLIRKIQVNKSKMTVFVFSWSLFRNLEESIITATKKIIDRPIDQTNLELAMPFKTRQFYNRRSKTPKAQPKRDWSDYNKKNENA